MNDIARSLFVKNFSAGFGFLFILAMKYSRESVLLNFFCVIFNFYITQSVFSFLFISGIIKLADVFGVLLIDEMEGDRDVVREGGLLTSRNSKVFVFIIIVTSLNSTIGVSTMMLSFIFFPGQVIDVSAVII